MLEDSIPLHSPTWKEMAFFFVSGAIIGIPVNAYLHNNLMDVITGISPFYLLIICELVLCPFIEEFSKVFGLIYRHGETQQSFFKLAVLSGLGFGIAEFLILSFDTRTFFVINFSGIFFHPLTVAITAYGLATNQAFRYYFLAVFFHFLNNLFLILLPSNIIALLTSVGIVIITYFIVRKIQNKTKNQFMA